MGADFCFVGKMTLLSDPLVSLYTWRGSPRSISSGILSSSSSSVCFSESRIEEDNDVTWSNPQ